MRRYVFYVVLWALAAAPVLIIVSVVVESGIAYQVLQHPKRGETSFRLWNGIATDLYYLYDANIWQNIRECVQYDETLLYKPSSGCSFNNREYSTVLTFSKDGRGNARVGDYSKTAIVFVGDSDTMGWGVNDDETFAYLVGAALGVPVFNLGVSSYGTARELLYARQNYGFLLAKCIVIQYNFNDFDENWGFVNAGALPSHSYADFEWLISYRRRKATFVDVLQRTTQYFVHFPIHFLADLFNLRVFPWRAGLDWR